MAKKRATSEYFEGASYDVALVGSSGLMVSFENDQPAGHRPGTVPAAVVPMANQYPGIGGDLTPWGDNNDFPQRLVNLYNQDPIIPVTLGKMLSMLVGGGVIAGIEGIGDDGNETFSALPPGAIADAIHEFINSDHFKQYLLEMGGDVTWFFNGFPELIISKDRSIITQIHPLNAEESRWCRMTPAGDLPFIYLSADWPRANTGMETVKKLNAIDPYRPDKVDWLRAQSYYSCVYPIRYPTPGKRFYSLPHHYALVESGWLDVHLAVPAYKKYLMKNQMTIKYHWKVDKEYWPLTYGEAYSKGTPAAKKAIKKTWLDSMTKSLTDVTKTGNSIMTDVTWDQVNKMFKDHITVTEIGDGIKDSKYIQDNIEAGAQIFYALNMDPTLVGYNGGSSQGQRSGGSDKREAYLIALQMIKPFRDMLLAPLQFTAAYNGWKSAIPKLAFRFRDTILTTLDTGAGTAKKLS